MTVTCLVLNMFCIKNFGDNELEMSSGWLGTDLKLRMKSGPAKNFGSLTLIVVIEALG